MEDPGQKLKRVRERLNLRYRDVEEASQKIAARHDNDEFTVALSRLADIENKGTVPTIYRLYTLCSIYRLDFGEVLEWYGVELGSMAGDFNHISPERTHPVNLDTQGRGEVLVPLSLDPGLDMRKTTFLSRVIQRWGKLPLLLLNGLDLKGYRYGFIGTDDWSMYPKIQPGSLVLIDESRRKIEVDGWQDESDRPIYFLEHRNGYACGWCSLSGEQLILFPHPSAHCTPQTFGRSEFDVLGQVTGVAMRFDVGPRRRSRS